MLLLVVLRETVIRRKDVLRDDELVRGGVEWPEVRAEDHDAERDVHVVMVLLHALLEVVREVLAQGHI